MTQAELEATLSEIKQDLTEFKEWKRKQELEQEKARLMDEESQREFDAFIQNRKKEIEQQQKDAEALKELMI